MLLLIGILLPFPLLVAWIAKWAARQCADGNNQTAEIISGVLTSNYHPDHNYDYNVPLTKWKLRCATAQWESVLLARRTVVALVDLVVENAFW